MRPGFEAREGAFERRGREIEGVDELERGCCCLEEERVMEKGFGAGCCWAGGGVGIVASFGVVARSWMRNRSRRWSRPGMSSSFVYLEWTGVC